MMTTTLDSTAIRLVTEQPVTEILSATPYPTPDEKPSPLDVSPPPPETPYATFESGQSIPFPRSPLWDSMVRDYGDTE